MFFFAKSLKDVLFRLRYYENDSQFSKNIQLHQYLLGKEHIFQVTLLYQL